jgi:glycerol-3-phosphate dehydrogenase (NAD(P)+)
MENRPYALIGSGSWATAIAKILTDAGQTIHWWIRNPVNLQKMLEKRHNPHYVSSISFDLSKIHLSSNINEVAQAGGVIIFALPSAFIPETLQKLDKQYLAGKKIVSAIKGLVQPDNLLLDQYLQRENGMLAADYGVISGPCHAEEVAAEKLSYLTFSSATEADAKRYAADFKTHYINTIVSTDVPGVQYAAVLKNIYALGAGIAHGLDYGDNFMSVYIANAADEMVGFLKKLVWDREPGIAINYAASAYLGDLLVTCYSLHSRNRRFGNYIGKGYSVDAARLEMNMVAEGYYATRSMHAVNIEVGARMPIAEAIYRILWEQVDPTIAFEDIERILL